MAASVQGFQTAGAGVAYITFPTSAADLSYSFPGATATILSGQVAALTSTRIPFADANGLLTDSPNLTFASSVLGVYTQAYLSAPFAGSCLHIVAADATTAHVTLDVFGAVNPNIYGRKAQGTKGSPTALLADNIAFQALGYGWDTAAYGLLGQFAFRSIGTMSGSDHGGYFTLNMVPAASTTAAECMRVVGGGAVYFPLLGTSASAANVYMNNGSTPANQLLRSTSSIRYKEDIENMDVNIAEKLVANARPIWFRSMCEADQTTAPATESGRQSFYGLIAEEVAVLDPRFVFWTHHPDDYENVEEWSEEESTTTTDVETGETITKIIPAAIISRNRIPKANCTARMIPDGVQYDRLIVPLLAVVQRLSKELEELKAKVK